MEDGLELEMDSMKNTRDTDDDLEDLFNEMDKDSSGCLDADEIGC
jgi:Ca2+-binding EF-hand superfamily protein